MPCQTMTLNGAMLVLLLAIVPAAARAEPPPGTDLGGPEHAWWARQHSFEGASCCGEADGFVLADEEVRVRGDGYQVLVDGVWRDVPADAMSQPDGIEPNQDRRGRPKVWITSWGEIRCFQRPAGM